RAVAARSSHRVRVFDSRGQLLADSAGSSAAQPPEVPAEVRQALGAGTGEREGQDRVSGAAELAVAARLERGVQVRGVVQITAPLLPIQLSLLHAVLIAIAAVVVGAIAAALFAFWQADSLLQPLGELTRMARWVGAGDLGHRVALAERGPLRVVSDALNAMGEQLQAQVSALESERRRLSAILATMADGVIIADAAGTVVLINAAAQRILRVPPRRGVGSSFVEVVRDHELARELQAAFAASRRQDAPRVIQLSGSPPRYVRVDVATLR